MPLSTIHRKFKEVHYVDKDLEGGHLPQQSTLAI